MFDIVTGGDNRARTLIANRQGLVNARAHRIHHGLRHGRDHFLLIALCHQLAFCVIGKTDKREHIGWVNRRGFHAHHNLIGAGCWDVMLDNRQDQLIIAGDG